MYGSDSNGKVIFDRLSNFSLEDEDLNCSSSGLSFSKKLTFGGAKNSINYNR
ncbi:hypothetical protein HSX44_00200 [Wolbachia endosymbiont of Onchocerca gibsoni]|nr:hypothetical protein [Wolbachia endosymbiont of Onchocerca gibsoni]